MQSHVICKLERSSCLFILPPLVEVKRHPNESVPGSLGVKSVPSPTLLGVLSVFFVRHELEGREKERGKRRLQENWRGLAPQDTFVQKLLIPRC